MRTKNIFKAVALAMLMPAMLLTTACSSEDDLVNNTANTENTINKGYALPVTVNVTREGDAGTRATYNESTRKLEFSAGDKLWFRGVNDGGAGVFTALLTWQSGGKFSGNLYTQNEYKGTVDALLTVATDLQAYLLPAGYSTYGFLSFYNNLVESHNAILAFNDCEAFALTKAEAVEQFTLEGATSYSGGFALSPTNPILSFTITGLAASTVVAVNYESPYAGIDQNVTTDASGKATFALAAAGCTNINQFTLTVAGNPITLVNSSKTLTAGKIYNITRAVTPPTLAQTMTTAGMTVKVKYNYADAVNYCLFSSNGDDTYTFQSGDGCAGGDEDCAKDLVVEGGKLVFKQNVYETIDDTWSKYGFSVTFDTGNNTYSNWVGPLAQEFQNPSFISVEVNSVPIALTQIITVSDLVKEQGQFWSEIINNNSDKIQTDGDNVLRVSDGAKLQYDMFGSGDWQYVRTTDDYQTMWTYKFEGD